MLSTRILTAVVVIPLVLAALFLLPPRAWGIVVLVLTVAAGIEWANLSGFEKPMRLLFAAGVLLIGVNLLFSPMSNFVRGWPDGIVLAVCLPATLFWVLVVPFWLRGHWTPASRLGMAVV